MDRVLRKATETKKESEMKIKNEILKAVIIFWFISVVSNILSKTLPETDKGLIVTVTFCYAITSIIVMILLITGIEKDKD